MEKLDVEPLRVWTLERVGATAAIALLYLLCIIAAVSLAAAGWLEGEE